MATILSLDDFRARSLGSKRSEPRQSIETQAVETQAAELMAAAAALLLEHSPANLKVAWILQDLCELLEPKKGAASVLDGANAAPSNDRDVLTNLG